MKRILLLVALLLSAFLGRAQFPAFSNRLVNDYADVLDCDEESAMEARLRGYYDTTSNCIIVVIVNDLGGYEAADFAQRLGEKWGVGTGKYSNGLVILLSPEEREVFIATGYGLEGVLPDVTCHRIAENYMKPYFREEKYYEGLEAGLDIILSVAAKEYTFEQFQKEQEEADRKELIAAAKSIGAVLVLFLLICVFFKYEKRHPSKRKLALQMIANAQTREALKEALLDADELRISDSRIEKAVEELRQNCVNSVALARTYKSLVDSMSFAMDVGADEQRVQMARGQAIAGIIAAIGSARSVAALNGAIHEASLVGVSEYEIYNGREKARMGSLSDLAKAPSVEKMQKLEEVATAFGASQEELRQSKMQTAQNALQRIAHPTDVGDVVAAIELAAALGVSAASINGAKESGKNYAMYRLAGAGTDVEISLAAEVALFLGVTALAVETAKKVARARVHRSFSSGGRTTWGGSGSSSGTFGGFGGGHFGGGGGGAKW